MTETPGPWEADRRAPGVNEWEVFHRRGECDYEYVAEFVTESNARRIAALPRLLNLLAAATYEVGPVLQSQILAELRQIEENQP